MSASFVNAKYKAVVYVSESNNNNKYDLQNATIGFRIIQDEKGIAKKIQLELYNVDINGKKLMDLLPLKSRAYVYWDVGTGWKECFRGYVWAKKRRKDSGDFFDVIFYDRGIYLQNSKDSFYFANGKSTKSIIGAICQAWGITCKYEYEEITHPKLAIYSQNISDTIIEVLEDVRKKTGKRYVAYFQKDDLYIHNVGTNNTLYFVKEKANLIKYSIEETMDGMVTKVVIRGKRDDDGNTPILATVEGDTAKYGTLQDEISKDKDTTLEASKTEANEILKEKGKPFINRSFTAVDNPDVVKGQKIIAVVDGIESECIVKSVDHNALTKTMDLEVYQ